MMRARRAALVLSALLTAPPTSFAQARDDFPTTVTQGTLVIAHVEQGSHVRYAGHDLRIAADGAIAFGIGRDEAGPVHGTVPRKEKQRCQS